jgi:hypothetical protein
MIQQELEQEGAHEAMEHTSFNASLPSINLEALSLVPLPSLSFYDSPRDEVPARQPHSPAPPPYESPIRDWVPPQGSPEGTNPKRAMPSPCSTAFAPATPKRPFTGTRAMERDGPQVCMLPSHFPESEEMSEETAEMADGMSPSLTERQRGGVPKKKRRFLCPPFPNQIQACSIQSHSNPGTAHGLPAATMLTMPHTPNSGFPRQMAATASDKRTTTATTAHPPNPQPPPHNP